MMSFLLMDESTILELGYGLAHHEYIPLASPAAALELSLANIPGKGEHMCTLFFVLSSCAGSLDSSPARIAGDLPCGHVRLLSPC